MKLVEKINDLKNNTSVMKYLRNTSWLLIDNALKLIVGLFIGAWVARHLGPEEFGIYSYAISFVAMFGGVATLGLDSIVVRELVKKEDCNAEILATTFVLKVFGASSALLLLCIALILFFISNEIKLISLIMGVTFLFQTSNVIKLYFQSIVKSKYFVIANIISVIISAIIKIILILSNAPLIDFAKVFLFDSLSLSLLLIYFYIKKTKFKIKDYSFNRQLAKELLKDSWPLIFAAIASVIKLKLGHVMLGSLGSFEDVGYYAAALRISELWFLIPVLLGSSIYPALIKARKGGPNMLKARVLLITRVMLAFAVPFAILVSVISEFLMVFLFGADYREAGHYLSIQIWSGLPYVVLFAYSQVTYIESKTKIHLYLSILSIASIAIFNYWLIPLFGGIGAVYASLITALLGSGLMIALVEKDIKIFTKGTKYV
ncbi:flippase [Vibrio parahaemolyticus]|uniref:flippase n=3 Tax=Vibrio parahaemolyticus TaxID=670 RepID=UPI00193572FC|nr:flippase [Vibrio parahaemolyticus]EGQ7794243.1 flippase [Vibrio parahaemolyticus]EGQ7807933.1 flippase [Vibrio parahaemolyticus]EJB8533044.1 flippase [Vibrio parahaemolyticus]EKQ5911137.1 flippase [Vibrio parahaemolyticus]ELZ7197727.1 flippase [Vibrio parahaemolyticus]